MGTQVCVVGAGSWGTTVAALVAHNAPTTLWARRGELADEINSTHVNSAYLAGANLPESLRAQADRATAWGEPDLAQRLRHHADLLDARLVDPLWRAFAGRALQVAA